MRLHFPCHGRMRALKEKHGRYRRKEDLVLRGFDGKDGAVSYNIVGEITGRDRESMILLSAHYDSYFSVSG